jgi:hypothetical protein
MSLRLARALEYTYYKHYMKINDEFDDNENGNFTIFYSCLSIPGLSLSPYIYHCPSSMVTKGPVQYSGFP